jgi:hypothetical protein
LRAIDSTVNHRAWNDHRASAEGAPGESAIRILLPDGDERVLIRIDDISALTFSGRDTAQGKSFDTWMKKYVQKKMAGESANIESESLDGPVD